MIHERQTAELLHPKARARLRDLVRAAIVHETIQRKSGGTCDSFIDGTKLALSAATLALCAPAMLRLAQDLKATHVGGETATALPIVGAVMRSKRQIGIDGFFIRDQMKDHGRKRVIEGEIGGHSRALIVDDVIGRGSAAERCIRILRDANVMVVGYCAIADRGEDGLARVRALGVPAWGLIRVDPS